MKSKLLLKKFFGVNDVFNVQKPDLANSDPVSSKTNFDEVLTHFEGSEFGFLKSRSYFPSLKNSIKQN